MEKFHGQNWKAQVTGEVDFFMKLIWYRNREQTNAKKAKNKMQEFEKRMI